MAFSAKYNGKCAVGDTIEVGDEVEYVEGELVHTSCAERLPGQTKFQGTSTEEMGY